MIQMGCQSFVGRTDGVVVWNVGHVITWMISCIRLVDWLLL